MMVITVLALLGFCFACVRFVRLPITVAPLYTVSCVIVFLYFSAYCQALYAGSTFLLVLGNLFIVYSCYYFIKHPSDILARYLTSSFVIWVFIVASIAFLVSFRVFYAWDTFMHWGPHAKLMSFYHSFIREDVVVIHKGYPPSASLFYYLFYRPSQYSEGLTYVAHLVLMLSPLTLIQQHLPWSKWRQTTFIYLALIVVLCAGYTGLVKDFARIAVDSTAGLMFGGLLILFLNKGDKLKKCLIYLPVIFAYVLLKPQLLGFVLVLTFLFIVRHSMPLKMGKAQISAMNIFWCALAILLTAGCALASWSHYLSGIHAGTEWNSSIILDRFVGLILGEGGPSFWMSAFDFLPEFALELPKLIFLLIAAGFIAHIKASRHDKKVWVAQNGILLVGFILFIASLFMYYTFSTVYYNGANEFSFNGYQSLHRYVALYFLGWLLFVFASFVEHGASLRVTTLNKLFIFILCYYVTFYSVALIEMYIILDKHNRSIFSLHSRLDNVVNVINAVVPSNSRIFIVWQSANALEGMILSYRLIPHQTNLKPFKFGAPPIGEEFYFRDISTSEFLDEISDYDYVFLAYTDSIFWERYGDLFSKPLSAEKPLVDFAFCLVAQNITFDFSPCTLTEQHGYLFKVVHDQGRVYLNNIVG